MDTIKDFLEEDVCKCKWCVGVRTAIRTMLADIEMAREVLTQITNCSIQEGLEQKIIADEALSALDKYKGGV